MEDPEENIFRLIPNSRFEVDEGGRAHYLDQPFGPTGRRRGSIRAMATVERANHNPTMMRVVNPLMKFLVARGWGSMADQVMVLHWTGKKSGNTYSTPVSRFDLDEQLFTQTKAGYKSNFVGGGPAELEFDGKRGAYTGTAIDDTQIVGQRMRSVLDALGIKDGSRALGLKIEGDPTTAELADFASKDGAVVIDFEPV